MDLQHSIKLPEGVDLLDRDVALSNALVTSSMGLGLFEKRLINAALAKMGKRDWPKGFSDTPMSVHEENWEEWTKLENSPFCVRVTAADYAKASGVEMSTAYTQLREAIDSLYERSITMRVRTEKGIEDRKIRWIYERARHEGQGWVELSWSPQITRHLYSLKNKFTIYKLRQTGHLTNYYSIRLFEQFAKHAPGRDVLAGTYAPTIEEFIHAIEVPVAYHKDFAGIRRRVIEKAVTELTTELNLKIDWRAKQRGRKVVGLEFHYAPAVSGDQSVLADDE